MTIKMIRISEQLEQVDLKTRLLRFEASTVVTCADLSNNNIGFLPDDFFPMYFIFIRELIMDFCNIREIARESFRNLGNLVKLSLDGNQIKKLDVNLFEKNFNLRYLSLNSNKIDMLSERFIQNIMNVLELRLDYNLLKIFSCNKSEKLERLSLIGNNIVKFYNNEFIELRYLNLNVNKIMTLCKSMYEGLPKLEILHLDQNVILVIELDALYDLRNLKEISLSFNKIEVITDFDFQMNSQLSRVMLDNNNIREVSDGAFANLEALISLNLSGNKIQVISDLVFANNGVLTYLNLSWNSISDLDRGAFEKLKNLRDFICDGNETPMVIEKELFEKNVYLKQISMSASNIIEVRDRAFRNLMNLKVLNLGLNRIKYLPEKCLPKNCIRLKLNLNDNDLSEILLCHLKELKLRQLNLSGNGNLFIGFDSLLNQSNLRMLNLSHTSFLLYKVPNLEHLKILKELDLSFCNLYEFKEKYFRGLKNLETLFLTGNSLEPITMQYIDKAKILNNSNIILKAFVLQPFRTKVIKGPLFSGLRNLRSLYLSRCDIIELSSNVFNKTKRLEFLDLSCNFIRSLEAAIFQNLQELKFLHLDDNYLHEFDLTILQMNVDLELLDLRQNFIQVVNTDNVYGLRNLANIYFDSSCEYSAAFFEQRNTTVHVN